jgi:hypothetical protein
VLFLFAGMTACSSERSPDRVPEERAATERPAHQAQAPVPSAPRGDPELKQHLLAELEDIRRENGAGDRSSEIQTLITELSALTRVLGVTARTLDRDGSFRADIESELRKFSQTAERETGDARRIMNAMTGVYTMYALLAKMRFVGNTDRQQEIQEIHDETIAAMRGDTPAVKAAAAIADACYLLSSMIIRDIDSEHRYDKAFEQIDHQYEQGASVAEKQEDTFINGMFRTFEVSQLWLLSINPKATAVITDLNGGVQEDSANATNLGMQMGIAAKYLFQISYLIASDTVQLTL